MKHHQTILAVKQKGLEHELTHIACERNMSGGPVDVFRFQLKRGGFGMATRAGVSRAVERPAKYR